jgi:hypothetical protein
VLYILKEANDGKEGKGDGNWNLANHLMSNGGGWQTWNNIARWQYLIEKSNEGVTWEKIPKADKTFRIKMLNKIAFLNLKKVAGGAAAKPNEIWTYSWEDKDLIKKQISMYNADVIICCGTGEMVLDRKLVELNEWKETSNGIKYQLIKANEFTQIIISFYHPANRGKKGKEMFNLLMNAYKEIQNIKDK